MENEIMDIVRREPDPQPWEEGEKIPWNDPDFSRRMLAEHLSQKHDAASRRKRKIEQQVAWIYRQVLGGKPARILDLGCGPGLYTAMLAELGHTCLGIDFSPASIEYARENSPAGCAYLLADIRNADFGAGYDLVMFIFGEFNVFRPLEAAGILVRAYDALRPGGLLLLEPSTFDAIYELGNQPATWYSAQAELFRDDPHLCLMESFWDDDLQVATERYYIVDAASGKVDRYAASTQAYHDSELDQLLGQVGFEAVRFYPSLTGKTDRTQPGLQAIVARK